jgi:hypothetical protein
VGKRGQDRASVEGFLLVHQDTIQILRSYVVDKMSAMRHRATAGSVDILFLDIT